MLGGASVPWHCKQMPEKSVCAGPLMGGVVGIGVGGEWGEAELIKVYVALKGRAGLRGRPVQTITYRTRGAEAIIMRPPKSERERSGIGHIWPVFGDKAGGWLLKGGR